MYVCVKFVKCSVFLLNVRVPVDGKLTADTEGFGSSCTNENRFLYVINDPSTKSSQFAPGDCDERRLFRSNVLYADMNEPQVGLVHPKLRTAPKKFSKGS